ncbi:MAG: 50S ribosomal protein L23 [Candidatus Hodarchaeales archaeon]|jgi:ribosomal protein L23
MKSYQIILTPIVTEAVFDQIERDNKLVFYVHSKANKHQIKMAFSELFNVMPLKVNTTITPKGEKKAFIKLPDEVVALDLATDFGMF